MTIHKNSISLEKSLPKSGTPENNATTKDLAEEKTRESMNDFISRRFFDMSECAKKGYKQHGRGVLFVIKPISTNPDSECAFEFTSYKTIDGDWGFQSLDKIPTGVFTGVTRYVNEYDPESEFLIFYNWGDIYLACPVKFDNEESLSTEEEKINPEGKPLVNDSDTSESAFTDSKRITEEIHGKVEENNKKSKARKLPPSRSEDFSDTDDSDYTQTDDDSIPVPRDRVPLFSDVATDAL